MKNRASQTDRISHELNADATKERQATRDEQRQTLAQQIGHLLAERWLLNRRQGDRRTSDREEPKIGI